MKQYGKHLITDADIIAVNKALKSEYLTQGNEVPNFEKNIKSITKSKYAVASNSATSSLHLACLALEVGQSDIVWVPAITFVASANCARYCGAKVDFVDINLDDFLISSDALEKKLIRAKNNHCLPKVLIVVHLAGKSCDMKTLWDLSRKYNFKIIEDASHAIGAFYEQEPVGCCRYSEISVFSFHPVKIITSGEGGIATTNSKILAERMQLLRTHGITKDSNKLVNIPMKDLPHYYEQQDLGFNYRMSDIHAALGNSQLQRLTKIVNRRNEIANLYINYLKGQSKITFQKNHNIDTLSSWHLFIVRFTEIKNVIEKRKIIENLSGLGIGTSFHYLPLFYHPYYKTNNFPYDEYPNSLEYFNTSLTIPLYPELENYEIEFIAKSIIGEIR